MTTEAERDTTAAELALGVLDGEERAQALRRVLAEPDFARDVERWRTHFATLFIQARSVEPPATLFSRIEAALAPRRIDRFLWPAVAAALAASLLLALLMRPVAVVPPLISASTLVATLTPTTGAPIPAVYDRARGEIRIAGNRRPARGRSAELWVIGQDGTPHALGLLTSGDRSVVAVAAENRSAMAPGNKLAISSEPQGGSTSGKPTGPIVAIGTFISV